MAAKELIEEIWKMCNDCGEQTEDFDLELAGDQDILLTEILLLCEKFLDEEK